MKPSARAVLEMLRRHPEGCTPLDALAEVGSFRLGARIWELKRDGYDVETQLVTTGTGKRIARYRLRDAA